MPFTGTGTGIQNANDVFFSGLAQDNVLRYNSTTAKWNNLALSVGAADITDGVITEPKLAVANSPTANQVLSWNGSALAWVTPAGGTVSGQSARSALAVVYASTVPSGVKPSATDAAQFVWVCDGTADDVEINAALSAIAAQGRGKVQLVGNLFSISATIAMQTGVWLSGEGMGTILSAATAINEGVITLADNTVHATKLSDLSINGTGKAVHGIHYLEDTAGLFTSTPSTSPDPAHIIDSLYIYSCGTATFGGYGMWMQGSALRAGKYSNIRILDCSGGGVFCDLSPDSHYTNIECGSCGKNGPAYSEVITAPIGHAFYVSGSNNMFTQCKGWYARGAGFYNKGVRNQYVNCQAQDNYSYGFHLSYGKISLVGCHADSNGQASGASGMGRAGFYLAGDTIVMGNCMAYDKAEGDTAWEQQWGFKFVSNLPYSRVTGCATYGNGLTTSGGSQTGTIAATTTVDIQADVNGG
jgi:hypothetical protein